MEKENKLATEQEAKDTKIVELKDEDLKTVSAGSDIEPVQPTKKPREITKRRIDAPKPNFFNQVSTAVITVFPTPLEDDM